MDKPGNIPSPRYWLLWPGVMIMVCYSFAEMLSHWRVIWMGMIYVWTNLKTAGRELQVSLEKSSGPRHGQITISSVASVEDEPGLSEHQEQTSAWVWGTGCLLILIVSCVIFEVQFGISWGKSPYCIPWESTNNFRPRDLVLHTGHIVLLPLHSQQWGD